MRQIVLLSGRTCTGKSKLATSLRDGFGFSICRTQEILLREASNRRLPVDRLALQRLGDTLDKETDHSWVIEAVRSIEDKLPSRQPIVVDNVRNWLQLKSFRARREWQTLHVHLYASPAVLEARFAEKRRG